MITIPEMALILLLNQLTEIDKWIINQTIKLQQEIKQLSNEFAYHMVVQKIHNFCVNELGGIYLDIIKDRMYVSKNDSQARKSAQIAMERILNILVRVVSPILSFTSEEIWQKFQKSLPHNINLFFYHLMNQKYL